MGRKPTARRTGSADAGDPDAGAPDARDPDADDHDAGDPHAGDRETDTRETRDADTDALDDATRARLARKARRREAKRRRILAAAADELLDAGVDGLTVASVAARADLSKPAVYYYFASREALLAGLLVDGFRRETEAILGAVAAAPDGVGALVATLRAYVGFYEGDLATYRTQQAWALRAGSHTELLKREVYPLSWALMSEVEAKLAADRARGRLHADADPRRLANLAMMLGHGLVGVYAGMDALGGELRFDLGALLDEAERTLRRACAPKRSRRS